MNDKRFPHHLLLTIAAIVVIVAGLRAAQSLVVPLVIALFVAILLTTPLRWFERKSVPTSVGLLLLIAAWTFVAAIGIHGVGRSLSDFSRRLPSYQDSLNEQMRYLQNRFRRFWPELSPSPRQPAQAVERAPAFDWDRHQPRAPGPRIGPASDAPPPPAGQIARSSPIQAAPGLTERLESNPASGPNPLPEGVLPAEEGTERPEQDAALSREGTWPAEEETAAVGAPPSASPDPMHAVPFLLEAEPLQSPELPWTFETIRGFLRAMATLAGSAVVIVVTVIFMLLEASRLPDKLRAAGGLSSSAQRKIQDITGNVRRYLAIKTGTSLLTGALVALLVWLLRLDFPMLWGLLAFLFNFVPQIGSILAAIPAIMLALVDQGPGTAIAATFGYLAINCLVSYALEPRFFAQGLGLSMLVVFVSLVFWGWVLGPAGMFLSAPLTMVLKIILEDFEETRWIAMLLGPKAPKT